MDTGTATAMKPENPAFAQQLPGANVATAAATNTNHSITAVAAFPYMYPNFPSNTNPFSQPYATAAVRMSPLPLPKKGNTSANQSTAKKSNVSKIRRMGSSNSTKDESLLVQTTNELLLFYSTPIFSAALNRSATLTPSPRSIGSDSNRNDATADNEDNMSMASESTAPSIARAVTNSTPSSAAAAAAAAAAKKASPASSSDAAKQYESASSPSPPTKAPKRKASKAPAKRATQKKKKTGNQYTASSSRNGLPKGVTQRASGKWQAQVYFCGASRYVGVFDTSHQASRAFSQFKKYLQPYKKRAQDGEYSREELQSLIDQGRQHASEAVQEWILSGKPFVAPADSPAAKPKEGE